MDTWLMMRPAEGDGRSRLVVRELRNTRRQARCTSISNARGIAERVDGRRGGRKSRAACNDTSSYARPDVCQGGATNTLCWGGPWGKTNENDS